MESETLGLLHFLVRLELRFRFLSAEISGRPWLTAICSSASKVRSKFCTVTENPCILVEILHWINGLDRRAQKVNVVRRFEVHQPIEQRLPKFAVLCGRFLHLKFAFYANWSCVRNYWSKIFLKSA